MGLWAVSSFLSGSLNILRARVSLCPLMLLLDEHPGSERLDHEAGAPSAS